MKKRDSGHLVAMKQTAGEMLFASSSTVCVCVCLCIIGYEKKENFLSFQSGTYTRNRVPKEMDGDL